MIFRLTANTYLNSETENCEYFRPTKLAEFVDAGKSLTFHYFALSAVQTKLALRTITAQSQIQFSIGTTERFNKVSRRIVLIFCLKCSKAQNRQAMELTIFSF